MLVVIGNGQAVLLADGAEMRQLGGDILAKLGRGGQQHRPEPGGVIDRQLRSWVPTEDGVLDTTASGRHVKPLAVPLEPIRAQMRSAVFTDAGDDGVAGFGEEGRQFLR